MTSTADAFVLALGAQTPWFARPLGLRLPVYPLKGYSLTLPVTGAAPSVSVTDFKRKVVYAPLDGPTGRQLRVAGMADIAGHSMRPDPVRVRQLVAEARAAFPRSHRLQRVASLTCSRGRDCVRRRRRARRSWARTPIGGLYVNCGQGALGWTLALASGRVVADAIAGRKSEISLEQFTLTD